MSYENGYSLKITGDLGNIKSLHCQKCETSTLDGKFCKECGTKLEKTTVPIKETDVMLEFCKTKHVDSLLNEDGSTNQLGSGNYIESDLLKFSKKYPKALFILDIVWEDDFCSLPSRHFFQNGKRQCGGATIVFEEFDKNKLK